MCLVIQINGCSEWRLCVIIRLINYIVNHLHQRWIPTVQQTERLVGGMLMGKIVDHVYSFYSVFMTTHLSHRRVDGLDLDLMMSGHEACSKFTYRRLGAKCIFVVNRYFTVSMFYVSITA